jgi:hypothetical protein
METATVGLAPRSTFRNQRPAGVLIEQLGKWPFAIDPEQVSHLVFFCRLEIRKRVRVFLHAPFTTPD